MTVAALLFSNTFPIVITDHLISSNLAPEEPITTPLTDFELRVGDAGDIPAGVAVKIWHVAEQMYMLYAGRVDHAREILNEVRARVAYKDYSEENHLVIKNWVKSSKLEASFILIYRGGDGYVHYNSFGAREYETTHFGRVLIIGSGESPLLHSLKKLQATLKAPPDSIATETMPHVEQAILNAMTLQADASNDYIKSNSNFANKSTGAQFSLSYLPKCYGWSNSAPPPVKLQHRTVEFFTRNVGTDIFISRAVISYRETDEQELNTIVYRNFASKIFDVHDGELLLEKENLTRYTIADVRDQSSVQPYKKLGASLGMHQVVVYAEITTDSGKAYTYNVVYRGGEAILKIYNGLAGLHLEFGHRVIEELWSRIKSSGVLNEPGGQR